MIPGFFYALITLVCYGIADALAAIPAKRMHPIALTLMIDGFMVVFFGLVSVFLWSSYQWNQATLIAMFGGLCGYLGFLLFIYSVQCGKVGVSATIANTYPAVTALFGVLVLGEYLRIAEVAAIAVVLFGVAGLTTQFSLQVFRSSSQKSAWLAFGAMFFWAGQIIVADYAVNTLPPFQVTHISVMTTLVFGSFLFFVTGRSVSSLLASRKTDLFVCTLLGTFYFLGMVLLNIALAGGKVGVYAAIAGAGPLITALLAHYFLGEKMIRREWLAVGIIVAGLVGLGVSG